MARSAFFFLFTLPPLLFLPLLLARVAPPTSTSTKSPAVTGQPEEREFELFAETCMNEENVTEEEVNAAFEDDPNHAPYILKCIWSCMYRKVGLLVDGQLPLQMPGEPVGNLLKEFEELIANCAEKVAATTDVCEKAAVLRNCAADVTTVTPV